MSENRDFQTEGVTNIAPNAIFVRPKTIGIYLVMWYSDKDYSTNVMAAYESEKRARAHAAPYANGNGLRTGDKVWVKEQVLHLDADV